MIFPFTERQQEGVADALGTALARGELPIVHVVRYPRITINHMLLVYAVEETPAEIRFVGYDPNDPRAPLVMVFDRSARTFVYPRTIYFPGGPVKAYEIYRGWLT